MKKISLEQNYSKYKLTGIFFLIYSYQGLFYGFFEALKIIITSKKTTYNQIALLELAYIPAYLKFLLSPFLEVYYFKRLGKRMGWVLIFSILVFFIFWLFSLKLEFFIENLKIELIVSFLILMSFLINIQDICIDSLSEENFKEDHVYWGILMQTFGQIVGPIISFNLFLYFHSNGYENIYFKFCFGFGLFILITTIFVFFIFEEIKPKILDNSKNNPFELYKIFPNFFKNKILFKYIMHLMTFGIGIHFFNSTLLIKMIKKGFKEQDINKIQYSILPIEFLNFFILKKLEVSKSLFKKYKISIFFYIIFVIINYLIFYFYNDGYISYNNFYNLLFFVSLFTIIRNIEFSIRSNFNVISCDEKLGSIYLSTMNSLGNVPHLIYKPIFIFLLGKFNYNYLAIFFICYSFIYYFYISIPFCNEFNHYKKKDFSIYEVIKKKIK